jgi:hypothetical protein
VSSEERVAADDDQQDQDQQQQTDTILISLVHAYDWAGNMARIASHPMETASCPQGRPPLHL